jgi:hypothetical protein
MKSEPNCVEARFRFPESSLQSRGCAPLVMGAVQSNNRGNRGAAAFVALPRRCQRRRIAVYIALMAALFAGTQRVQTWPVASRLCTVYIMLAAACILAAALLFHVFSYRQSSNQEPRPTPSRRDTFFLDDQNTSTDTKAGSRQSRLSLVSLGQ